MAKLSKKCRICGGKPCTLKFNVSSCEICQAFFERRFNKKRKLKCGDKEKCNISQKASAEERCMFCWMEKCLKRGMSLEEKILDESPQVSGPDILANELSPDKRSISIPIQEDAQAIQLPKYEVRENLKSLFGSAAQTPAPFRFFADEETEADSFTPSAVHPANESDEEPDQEFTNSIFSNPINPKSLASFFFTENDPRLLEGLRYLSMTAEEKAASVEEWKIQRPQLFADFKKIKKQANRKRKAHPR